MKRLEKKKEIEVHVLRENEENYIPACPSPHSAYHGKFQLPPPYGEVVNGVDERQSSSYGNSNYHTRAPQDNHNELSHTWHQSSGTILSYFILTIQLNIIIYSPKVSNIQRRSARS